MKLSLFQGCIATKPFAQWTARKLMEAIRDGKWKDQVLRARKFAADGNEASYNATKKKLPAFTASGCCLTRRSGASDKEAAFIHTGLIQADFDAADNPGISVMEMRRIAEDCPHTYAAFRSPSGTGLKALVRCRADVDKHLGSFLAAEKWFKARGVKIDRSTKDPKRLCFASYDPKLFLNENALPIKALKRPEKPNGVLLSPRQSATSNLTPTSAEKPQPPRGWVREVLGILAADESRPDYPKWVNIAFQTFDGVGIDEGIELLSEFFPEERQGEYAGLAQSFDSKRADWRHLGCYLGIEYIDPHAVFEDLGPEEAGRSAPSVKEFPSQGAREKTRRAPLTIRSIAEILAMPDSPADLILANGYIEKGERTAICGMGGVGKSRLMMQLAMMHRAGRPFLAWETRSRELKWLFLQTENGTRRLKNDLTAMLTGFSPREQAAIKAGIFIHTLEGEDDGSLLLSDPANQERAIQAILESGAGIVVWDPLRDFTGDDLNKDVAMAETLRTIRSITRSGDPHRTCLIIHHAGEGRAAAAKATGYDRGAFGRNSKVLKGWARAQINVAPAAPNNNAQIVIASGKCNNFEEFAPISARLNPRTLLYELVQDFDLEAWQESLTGTREKPTTDKVIEVLSEAGGSMEKKDAIAKLQAAGIGRDRARNLIDMAVVDGEIEETSQPRPGKKSSKLLRVSIQAEENGEGMFLAD